MATDEGVVEDDEIVEILASTPAASRMRQGAQCRLLLEGPKRCYAKRSEPLPAHERDKWTGTKAAIRTMSPACHERDAAAPDASRETETTDGCLPSKRAKRPKPPCGTPFVATGAFCSLTKGHLGVCGDPCMWRYGCVRM